MLYKADTGKSPKVGIEFERSGKFYSCQLIFSEKELKAIFNVDEDIIEFPTPEYINWLEEKVEQLTSKS